VRQHLRLERETLVVAIVLAVAAAAVYWTSFDSGFHFDDSHAIEHNPFIRSLANVPRFFVDADTTTVLHENKDLRPVLLTTFALNYAISGYAPWSWHLLNLLLHWAAALLVFRIVRDHLWLGDDAVPVAAAAALLVAVHPLNTEPVVYLSARSALLVTVLYLGAFDAAVRRRTARCLVLFALALLTKAIAITLPLAVGAYWLVARAAGRPTPVSRRLGAGLVAVAAAGVAYRAILLPPWVYATSHAADVTPWRYLMTEWSAYLYYLRLFVWPDALVIDRLDYPFVRSITEPQAWGSLAVVVGIGALAWRVRRRVPALTFAVLWYVVALAAESTVFPLAEAVNEHRPYLGMLGLATAAALGLHAAAKAIARRAAAAPRTTLAIVVAVVAMPLGARSIARNELWCDDYALWRDATAKAPANPRAWLNAGYAAMAADRLPEARRLLLEAHRLHPCYAYVLMNLSALEARAGAFDESLRWADEGVRCNPTLALTHYYRAAALERRGRDAEALAAFRRTTELDPQHADAWSSQARLLERAGAWAAAAAAYERALVADPTLTDAAMHAALLRHYRLRDPAGAVGLYRTVLRLVPTHYGAHYQLAVALLASGRDQEARMAWRAFVPMAEQIGDRTSLASAPEALTQP
jgi:protein O-mannosyl-transferase